MIRHAQQTLAGWGNFPRETCQVARPEKRRELRETILARQQPSYISRGLGRGYGDAALNRDAGVLLHTRLDRFLSFDDSIGLLECEAGATLADVLATFVPRGWFPAVTPGTQFVTIGGMIAADVHGKNHHVDGTIGSFVDSFDLLTASGETLRCSRDQNVDAFRATLGGMGLTGAILSARLRLRRVESAYVTVDYRRAANLDAALERFAAGDEGRYSVAWIDCLSSGESLGRSVLMSGEHATAAELPMERRVAPLQFKRPRRRTAPFDFPSFALNSWSVRAFNAAYYHKHSDGRRVQAYEPFFYPLDAVRKWNRLYGKRGFVQYQVVLPPAGARAGLVQLLEKLSASKRASFLAVLKRFGPQGEGLLSFPTPGYTLALDLPNTGPDLIEFIHGLDQIVLSHGGRVYLAKDACLTRPAFEAMYPNLGEFKRIQRELDPKGVFSSSLARRLGIVEAA